MRLILLTLAVCLVTAGQPINVGAAVQAAKLVRRVDPLYPPLARQGRVEGDVRFKAEIAADGSVRSLELETGHPLLAPAARDAVLHWRYSPTLVNGEPVAVSTLIVVPFKLSGAPPAALPSRIRVGGNAQAAKLIHRVDPVLPIGARMKRIQGVVRFNAVLRANGSVDSLDLAGGHPLLVAAARAAVMRWRYQPTLLDGRPVEVATVVEVLVRP